MRTCDLYVNMWPVVKSLESDLILMPLAPSHRSTDFLTVTSGLCASPWTSLAPSWPVVMVLARWVTKNEGKVKKVVWARWVRRERKKWRRHGGCCPAVALMYAFSGGWLLYSPDSVHVWRLQVFVWSPSQVPATLLQELSAPASNSVVGFS